MMSGDLSVRLCVLRLWPDFQGYGFNLHGEKNKSGHFIGDVEDDSPASSAGLRAQDRLIEVNGVNVYSESHKEVVQRIKAGGGVVSMLVTEAEVESLAIERGIVLTTTNTSVERIEAVESLEAHRRAITTEAVVEARVEEPERSEEEQREYEEPEPEPEVAATPEVVPEPEPVVTTVVSETVVTQENGAVESSTTTVVETSNGDGEQKMTAAEFRAMLQNRKKNDPRKSGTSFKDKTLMFEKM